MVAKYKAPRIHTRKGTAFGEWYAALETLIRDDDGATLANLLRRVETVRVGRRGLVPMVLLRELANLLDPQTTWSIYDQRRTKDNGVRLKIHCAYSERNRDHKEKRSGRRIYTYGH